MIATLKVVTRAERVQKIFIQPENRDWATAIVGINSQGWSIPPFVIMKAVYIDESWYQDWPRGWRFGVSDNGWTTNKIGLLWIQHYNQYTINRTRGLYRLLVLDSHGSHVNVEFNRYCEANKIITVYMPPHSSHLLQPLDVA